MASPDHSIDPRILKSAKKEFSARGFEKTSLQTICKEAGITTGALYKRYKGKEDLFCAVVMDTVAEMERTAAERGSRDAGALSDEELMKAWDMDVADMMWWFQFLYDHHDDIVLLLKCAEGTVYANFQHDWVEKIATASYPFLEEMYRRKLIAEMVSKEELHILLTAFWITIYEPFIHGYSWAQIEAHCKIVCRLFNWRQALAFYKSN